MTISSQKQKLMTLLQTKLVESVEADLSVIDTGGQVEQRRLLKALELSASLMANVSDGIGLKGLAGACTVLKNNFQLLSVEDKGFPIEVRILIKSWAAPLSGYFHSLGHSVEEHEAVEVILDFLSDPAWPTPLNYDSGESLKSLFTEPFVTGALGLKSSPVVITREMASLAIASDVEQEIVNDFLAELDFQVEAFDCAIEQYLITEDDVQLRVAQRIAHTIKGSANLVGVKGMVYLMHYVEDVLSIPVKSRALEENLGFMLQDVSDCLSSISEYLNGLGPKPEEVASVIQSVADSANVDEVDIAAHSVQTSELDSKTSVLSERKEQVQKVFHLENLIAFNDPGLKRIPAKFKSEIFDLDSKKREKANLKKATTLGPFGKDVVMLVSNDEMDDVSVPTLDENCQLIGLEVEPESETIECDETLDVKISDNQKQDLLRLVGESQRFNAKILSDIESYILSIQCFQKDEDPNDLLLETGSIIGEDELFLLKQQLLKQSQVGLAIQSLLSEICLSPQNIFESSVEASADQVPPVEPVEMTSSQVLIVCMAASKICLLSEAVQRIIYVEENCLVESDEGYFYRLANEEEPIPVFTIDEMIFPNTVSSTPQKYSTMLLVTDDHHERYGVLIESIVGRAKQRVKPLGPFDHKAPGVFGSTVLDGGAVSPVVDLLSLIEPKVHAC